MVSTSTTCSETTEEARLALPLICAEADPAGAEAVARLCVAHDFPNAVLTDAIVREASLAAVGRERRMYGDEFFVAGRTVHWPLLVSFGRDSAEVAKAFDLAF